MVRCMNTLGKCKDYYLECSNVAQIRTQNEKITPEKIIEDFGILQTSFATTIIRITMKVVVMVEINFCLCLIINTHHNMDA